MTEPMKQSWEKELDDNLCTIGEEDDVSNPNRIMDCASAKACYCPITGKLLCKTDEACGKFNMAEPMNWCIKKKHCDLRGNFTPYQGTL